MGIILERVLHSQGTSHYSANVKIAFLGSALSVHERSLAHFCSKSKQNKQKTSKYFSKFSLKIRSYSKWPLTQMENGQPYAKQQLTTKSTWNLVRSIHTLPWAITSLEA